MYRFYASNSVPSRDKTNQNRRIFQGDSLTYYVAYKQTDLIQESQLAEIYRAFGGCVELTSANQSDRSNLVNTHHSNAGNVSSSHPPPRL